MTPPMRAAMAPSASLTDFRLFYKTRYADPLDLLSKESWDRFISAYNLTERVEYVFRTARATRKDWLVHSEYSFGSGSIPSGAFQMSSTADEADWVLSALDVLEIDPNRERVCFDITGMMRPHLMCLLGVLADRGVRYFDALYCEPGRYVERHRTTFGAGTVTSVRPVRGLAGLATNDASESDLLVIGSGYEHNLIAHVAEDKGLALKVQLYGFPPLQPDFYQQSFVRADISADAVGRAPHERRFAAAYDPFATAATLRDIVRDERDQARNRKLGHVYLSPLATRAQALGFALYYLYDCIGTATTVIYPFAPAYEQRSAVGIGGLWHFRVELPSSSTTLST